MWRALTYLLREVGLWLFCEKTSFDSFSTFGTSKKRLSSLWLSMKRLYALLWEELWENYSLFFEKPSTLLWEELRIIFYENSSSFSHRALLQVVLSLFYEKSLEFFYEKSFDSTVKRASTFLQEVFRQFYEKNLHEIIDCSRPREDLLCGSKRRPLAPGLWSFEGRSDGHLKDYVLVL